MIIFILYCKKQIVMLFLWIKRCELQKTKNIMNIYVLVAIYDVLKNTIHIILLIICVIFVDVIYVMNVLIHILKIQYLNFMEILHVIYVIKHICLWKFVGNVKQIHDYVVIIVRKNKKNTLRAANPTCHYNYDVLSAYYQIAQMQIYWFEMKMQYMFVHY